MGGASLWWGSGSGLAFAVAIASLVVLVASLAWGVEPRHT
jgi:hypothetical protein